MAGYSTQCKGYKIWDTESSKLIVSRGATFDETTSDPPKAQTPSSVEIPSDPDSRAFDLG